MVVFRVLHKIAQNSFSATTGHTRSPQISWIKSHHRAVLQSITRTTCRLSVLHKQQNR